MIGSIWRAALPIVDEKDTFERPFRRGLCGYPPVFDAVFAGRFDAVFAGRFDAVFAGRFDAVFAGRFDAAVAGRFDAAVAGRFDAVFAGRFDVVFTMHPQQKIIIACRVSAT
jgi:hypothetical protein